MHMGEDHVKMKADIGVMLLQTKGSPATKPPAADEQGPEQLLPNRSQKELTLLRP